MLNLIVSTYLIASSHEGGRGGVDGAMGNSFGWGGVGYGGEARSRVGGRLTHATGWGDGGLGGVGYGGVGVRGDRGGGWAA